MRSSPPVLRRCVRSGIVVYLAALLLLTMTAPASAHTRSQAASDYESWIVTEPAIEGATWRLYAGGDLVSLDHAGHGDLIVLGYEGEPYLRLRPDGVYENRNSPATYVNAERYGDVALPPRADATAPPEWAHVSDEPSWAWHDHRVHWMSSSPPEAVTASDGGDVHLFDWTVELTYEGEPYELAGTLHWVEPRPWWPWLVGSLIVTSAMAAGVLRPSEDLLSLLRPAALGVATVALLNSIHFVDEFVAWPAPTLDIVFGVFHTVLFVGVGLVGAAVAWRARQASLLALGIGSGAVLFHQGLLQLPMLTSSQLPTIWPEQLLRVAVAASIAQAVWVAVVTAAALRRRGATPASSRPAAATTASPARTDHTPRPHEEIH